MPIYYNTAIPSPSTKNTINSVTVGYGIRDFLLKLNINNLYPQIATTINGSPKVGEPVLDTMLPNQSVVKPNGLPLEINGILWKEINISTNTFKNLLPTNNALKSVNFVNTISNVDFVGATVAIGAYDYPTAAGDEYIKNYGILTKTNNASFKTDNVIKNLYLDVDKQIDSSALFVYSPPGWTQQIKGYLDTYGKLNLGGSESIKAANVIGSIVGGQGLGLAKGGLVTSFDIRTTLAGRVLGATGVINDTKLGLIGGQQLALSLANNASFNIQQELLGKLNVKDNILGLIKNGTSPTFRPNYRITIPQSGLGKVADYTAKILGFTLPRSYLLPAGSIFSSENGNAENITRANAMLLNTGKGQVKSLIKNINSSLNGTSADGHDSPNNEKSLFRSGYAAGYSKSKDPKDPKYLSTSNIYAYGTDNKIDVLGSTDGIPNLSYLRTEKTETSGFKGLNALGLEPTSFLTNHIKRKDFSWGAEKAGMVNSDAAGVDQYSEYYTDAYKPVKGDKKSLLRKTQLLFNSEGMLNIVSREGTMGAYSSEIQTANGGGISKGSAVLTKGVYDLSGGTVYKSFNQPENTYCRAWTTKNRYDNIQKLIRNDGLYTEDSKIVPHRNVTQNSVLEDTGYVKIAPYTTDFSKDAIKNYMFSIENLAWSDNITDLPKVEQGPGDGLSGKKGRVMWFPPYNISFSESTSVEWESHKFIGRGENMYTYNNTERTGQLSFQIIVDHPNYVNTFRGDEANGGPDDNYVASFFAGCIDPDSIWTDKLTAKQSSDVVSKTIITPQQKVAPKPETPPDPINIYYPNDNANLPERYENGLSGSTTANTIDYSVYMRPDYSGPHFGLESYPSNFTPGVTNDGKGNDTWPDRNNYGLNYNGPYTKESSVGEKKYKGISYGDTDYFIELSLYIKDKCPNCIIEFTGYASPQGKPGPNKKLATARADIAKTGWRNLLKQTGNLSEEKLASMFKVKESIPILKKDSECEVCPEDMPIEDRMKKCPPDTIGCKLDRYVNVTFVYDADAALAGISEPEPIKTTTKTRVNTKIINKFYNESLYFDKLKKNDDFIFDKFSQKIKYFHPAFHSTTPEGLNSRLTFLQQCTRQGATNEAQGANNLAFGRAPICILKIGDFYNTKIVIDNVSFDYEPLVWDLNPEGIGVQPMIANVQMSFKFIGGESLQGPINKLQNALSFNFFANTQTYDNRADYLSEQRGQVTNSKGELEDEPLSKGGMYLKNGSSAILNEEIIRTSVIESVVIEGDQVAVNEKVNSGKIVSTVANTSVNGYSNFDIISTLDILTVDYVKESKDNIVINVKLRFREVVNGPNGNIKDFLLSEKLEGKLYIKEGFSKRKDIKMIGTIKMEQSSNPSVVSVISKAFGSAGQTNLNVHSYKGQLYETEPRDGFSIDIYLSDKDIIEFFNERMESGDRTFTIKWVTDYGAESYTSFPYPRI